MAFAIVPLLGLIGLILGFCGLRLCYRQLSPLVAALWRSLGCPPLPPFRAMCVRYVSKHCIRCLPTWAVTAAQAMGVGDVLLSPNAKYEVYYTKKMRRELALKFGRKWRANAVRLGKVRDHRELAVRAAAGPTQSFGLSPDRQKHIVKKVVPHVSPEKLRHHATVKHVHVRDELAESNRRPELHKALKAAEAPEVRLKAWAHYRGFHGAAAEFAKFETEQAALRVARKERIAAAAAEAARQEELRQLALTWPMERWDVATTHKWVGLLSPFVGTADRFVSKSRTWDGGKVEVSEALVATFQTAFKDYEMKGLQLSILESKLTLQLLKGRGFNADTIEHATATLLRARDWQLALQAYETQRAEEQAAYAEAAAAAAVTVKQVRFYELPPEVKISDCSTEVTVFGSVCIWCAVDDHRMARAARIRGRAHRRHRARRHSTHRQHQRVCNASVLRLRKRRIEARLHACN